MEHGFAGITALRSPALLCVKADLAGAGGAPA
jgi:hypothetical protein